MAKKPRKRVVARVFGEPRTKQQFKDECDINNILGKFERTGLIEHQARFSGRYGDFSNAPGSFHEAQNIVIRAEEMFMTVPAKLRARFGNDPGAFLDFVTDPENGDEIKALGLGKSHANAKPKTAEGGTASERPRADDAPKGSESAGEAA